MYFVFPGTTCRETGDTVELVVQELIEVSLKLLLNYWINLASLEYTILNIFFIVITKLNPKDSIIKIRNNDLYESQSHNLSSYYQLSLSKHPAIVL